MLSPGRAVNLVVHPFFDADTRCRSYLIANPGSGCCAIVDPVLGYDVDTGTTSSAGADLIADVVATNGYCVAWILETNVHVDHLSAARYLQQQFVCAQLAIGVGVQNVQSALVNELGVDAHCDGRQYDRLLDDGERICLGHACGRVLHTPGLGGAGVSYVFDRFAFVGGILSSPDGGTGRSDLPGGDATLLYRSVQKIYALPGETLVLGGGCATDALGARLSARVAEHRRANSLLRPQTPIDDFVEGRRARDRDLERPAILEAALRANLAGGIRPNPPPGRDDSRGLRRHALTP